MTFTIMMALMRFLVACSPSQEGPVGGKSVEMDSAFSLALGESATIPSEDLTITFAEVTEDSRCPTGVQCVWEGQVTTQLNISQGSEELGQLKLTSRAGLEDLAVGKVNGYTIELLSVKPYPKSGSIIEPSDYTATFTVNKS